MKVGITVPPAALRSRGAGSSAASLSSSSYFAASTVYESDGTTVEPEGTEEALDVREHDALLSGVDPVDRGAVLADSVGDRVLADRAHRAQQLGLKAHAAPEIVGTVAIVDTL